MNGLQCQRHVPHVGRATAALLCFVGVWKDTTKRLGIAAVDGSHGRIVTHLRIGWTAPKDLQLRTGGECPSFKATQDFGADLIEAVEGLGAYDVTCCGLGWDDVWRIAALGDNAMHAVSRTDVLTQQPNGDLRNGQRIRGKTLDRKSTRLNSSHLVISYAVFCLKKKNAP